ncbi:TPA: hypothetical protein ACS8CD_000296 [Providencia alcalifaciens]
MQLPERQKMLIHDLNDRDYLMRPISSEKFQEIRLRYSDDNKLAGDLQFLMDRGLVHQDSVIISIDGFITFNTGIIGLTADGVDFTNQDSIGNEVKAVTVKIHDSTIKSIQQIIESSDLSKEEKAKITTIIKEKGAEAFVGKCVDTVFANAGLAAIAMKEAIKSFF